MKAISLTILLILFYGQFSIQGSEIPTHEKVRIDSSIDLGIQIFVSGKRNARVGNSKINLDVLIRDSLNNPIDSMPLFFTLEGNNSYTLNSDYLLTDSSGIANLELGPFSDEEEFAVIVKVQSPSLILAQNEILISVRKKNWVFVLVVGLLGGLSFFLYGMQLMSNGLQNSAGSQMRQVLEKLTNNRLMGAAVGALITAVIQSSSATNVMLVSFVNSRLMRFRQTIGIILGAAIGTTITAQIIAFKLADYALVFVTIGLVMHFMSKKERLSEVSRAILGFGILFYGMHVMSESMVPLRSFQPFIDVVISLENPVIGIIVGTLFTALIQSSSAFIGILIVISMQGLLSFNASISLIIGANIGTAITAILASINTSREAKQVAIAHTLIKITGAVLVLLVLPYFIQLIHLLDGEKADNIASPRQIANAHTIYNVFLFVIFIPFTNGISTLVNKVYPSNEIEDKVFSLSYIHESLLSTPEIALSAARKELIKMMLEVQEMFQLILVPFATHSREELETIELKEEKVNFWRAELVEFLVQLSRGERSKQQIEETFLLLNAAKEFEQIADIISGQLFNKAESWCSSRYEFSESGKKELEDYHQRTLSIIQKSISVYKDFNIKKAQKLKVKYTAHSDEYFELERQHYNRLKKNVETTVLSSRTHLELITLFKVISSHATNTARTIVYRKQKKKKQKVNDKNKS